MEKLVTGNFPHICEKILGPLQPEDFLKCLCVSKSWKAWIEGNLKIWQIIGCKVIHKYEILEDYSSGDEIMEEEYEDQRWEHWEAFETVLLYHTDPKVVSKMTKILIWFDAINQIEPIDTPLRFLLMKSPEKLDYVLSISDNKNPRNGWVSLLHDAAAYGNLESVKVIAKNLGDKNPRMNGSTPFGHAVRNNHVSCIEYLIAFVCDEDLFNHIQVASMGYLQITKIIASNLEERNLLNDSVLYAPVIMCIFADQLECFQYLITKYEDVQGLVKNCINMDCERNFLRKILHFAFHGSFGSSPNERGIVHF